MDQPVKHTNTVQTVFWLALISSWLTFIFFFTIPFGLLFWICAVVYLFIKKTQLKWYLLIASSWTIIPALSFVLGSKDYFQGKATIENIGLVDAEYFNLDPKLRAWKSSSGCMVIGFEPFTQVPNNLAVNFWTSLLGPQKGVYNGVYPTKEQAIELMNKSVQVGLTKDANTIHLNYNNQSLLFQPDVNEFKELENTDSLKAAVFNNQCLLVEIATDTNKHVTLLADKSNGKIFARYYDYQTR